MSQQPQLVGRPVDGTGAADEDQKTSMKEAFRMRGHGASRQLAVDHLVLHGHSPAVAEVLINHYDRSAVKLGRTQPDDIDPSVLEQIRDEAPEPTQSPEPASDRLVPAGAEARSPIDLMADAIGSPDQESLPEITAREKPASPSVVESPAKPVAELADAPVSETDVAHDAVADTAEAAPTEAPVDAALPDDAVFPDESAADPVEADPTVDEVAASAAATIDRAALEAHTRELLERAGEMGAHGESQQAIIGYLTRGGIKPEQATRVATKIIADLAESKAAFEREQKATIRSASIKIALGLFVVLAAIVLKLGDFEYGSRFGLLFFVVVGGIAILYGMKVFASAKLNKYQVSAPPLPNRAAAAH